MPVRTWKIIDQSGTQEVAPSQLVISKDEMPSLGNAAVIKRTYAGGLSDGVVSVEISNGEIEIDVLPTRGMGIWRVLHRSDDPSGTSAIGWKSPNRGPVHPAFVDLGEPSGVGWLDGFDELLCRCGLESNGAPDFDDQTNRLKYPLHGRIANRPAHDVELTIDTDKGEITLRGVVEETRFHFLKLRMTTTITTRFGKKSFTVSDEVENFSASPTTMQMLYHVNFGLPLLDAGSRVLAPVKTIVPRNPRAASGIKTWDSFSAPEPGFEEQVYFFELNADGDGLTRAMLKNAHGTRGASLLFNKQQLPYFTLWKNTTAEADGYVTGLEPGTNFPNPRSFETVKKRVVQLAPGQKQKFDVTMQIHTNGPEVEAAEAMVAKIQAGRQPDVIPQPRADWCA
jgi:galactose mutarotase-like enzyme